MGRKSKLTDAQWAEIKKRLLAGESRNSLSREFGVSGPAITQRLSKKIVSVKDVANQIVSADLALRNLPREDQLEALSLADDLRAISTHLASAGKFGAATAHRLSGIAHSKVQEIDDAAPLTDESLNALKSISALTRLANDASQIPLNLLAANKEAVKALNNSKATPTRVEVEVVDATRRDAQS